jgi:hypothetical protein
MLQAWLMLKVMVVGQAQRCARELQCSFARQIAGLELRVLSTALLEVPLLVLLLQPKEEQLEEGKVTAVTVIVKSLGAQRQQQMAASFLGRESWQQSELLL